MGMSARRPKAAPGALQLRTMVPQATLADAQEQEAAEGAQVPIQEVTGEAGHHGQMQVNLRGLGQVGLAASVAPA